MSNRHDNQRERQKEKMTTELSFAGVKFKRIQKFPNNYISKCGKVYNIYSKKIRKLQKDNKGYLQLNITNGRNNRRTIRVHRLVAETYLPKINKNNQIHHKDNNKLNNHVENLEWCDYSEIQYKRYKNTQAEISHKI